MDNDLLAIQEVRDLLGKAKVAAEILRSFTQSQVDRVVEAMCEAGYEKAELLARMAVEETGMGRVDSKTFKNVLETRELWNAIKDMKTVGLIRRDDAKRVYEMAEPVGVIAAIVPTTNPTSTALYKCIIALKARNTIVISPHPRAMRCTAESARVVYEAALRTGAPVGCIGWMTISSLDATKHLMRHRDTSLILSTGGHAIVHEAYSSGKPALGVGPGNVPAFIERTADIPRAVKAIVVSQTFDWGTVCGSEQGVIVDAPIRQQVLDEFVRQGAYLASEEDCRKLEPLVIKGNLMNPEVVGKSPERIGQMAGVPVPRGTTVILVELREVGPQVPLSREKLCPILGLYTEPDWIRGCERCIDLLKMGGLGHTLVIHSRDERVIMEFALKKPAFRVLVNTPASQGCVGGTTYLFPSMTLGCGAWGGNITSDNISPKNLLNIKYVAIDREDPFRFSESMLGQAVGSSSVTGMAGPALSPVPAGLVPSAAEMVRPPAGQGWAQLWAPSAPPSTRPQS